MLKRISLLLVSIIFINLFSVSVFSQSNIQVKLDGEYLQFDVSPLSVNGRILVPMRAIFEKLGYEVEWNGDDKSVLATRKNKSVYLQLDNNKATFTNAGVKQDIILDTAPTSVNGRTVVPLRFVAETAGAKVDWDGNTRTVIINSYMNNPFNPERLQELVDNTPVDKVITDFRATSNPRRNGLKKASFKYFDLYYPDDDTAQKYADYISKYADTVYMFLTEVFGKQVPVEVHLIREEDAENLMEGNIREKEKVAFVYINQENTLNLGNVLHETVHEMYHNFFSEVNNDWVKTDDTWSFYVDEGIARIIGAVYMEPRPEFFTYDGNFSLHNLDNEITTLRSNMDALDCYPTAQEAAEFLYSTWYTKNQKERILRNSCIVTWMYLYHKYGYKKFEEVVKTIGQKDFKIKVEHIYGISFENLYKELFTAKQ